MITASPRSNCPVTPFTPAGRRLRPDCSADRAPASITTTPFGSKVPAIHRLRAVIGFADAKNQVQEAPLPIACSGCSSFPDAMIICVPAATAIFAAASFVTIPPRESSVPASPAIASISGVIAVTTSSRLAAGLEEGGAVYSPSTSESRTRQSEVIIPIANFRGRNGIILVNHRNRAELEQRSDGVARVEIAPPFLRVAGGHQNLSRAQAAVSKYGLIGVSESDLAYRGCGLRFFKAKRPAFQPQGAPAQGNCTG